MKLLLLSLSTLLGAVILFGKTNFDFLDIYGEKSDDISWDDITDDLWP